MSLLKLSLLSLSLLHTSQALENAPFTWQALEEAEKVAATAAASLYTGSVRLQQTVKERVFAPDIAETTSQQICQQHIQHTKPQSPTYSGISLLFVAFATAFLLGWFGGLKQAESSHALQEAKSTDQAEADASEASGCRA